MKKIVNLLSFLLIINFIILGNLLIKYNNNLDYISYAKNKHNDNYNLIISILKDVNKNNLIEYADHFNINKTKFLSNNNISKIAYTLSLPQKASFIAIYTLNNNEDLIFDGLIDNLSEVVSISSHDTFLSVEQKCEDLSLSSSEQKYIEFFKLEKNTYSRVFKKDIFIEKLYKDNDTSYKTCETSSIDYMTSSNPKIICITTLDTFSNEPSILDENSFDKLSSITKKQIYTYDNAKNKFIISNEEIIK